MTFGPDGLTGHPDHRAVSAWVDVAVAPLDDPPTVLHATIEGDHGRRWAYLNDEYDLMLDDDLPRLGERHELSLFLALEGSELDRKLVALRAMATQTADVIDAFGDDVYRPWVSTEAFVLAPVSH